MNTAKQTKCSRCGREYLPRRAGVNRYCPECRDLANREIIARSHAKRAKRPRKPCPECNNLRPEYMFRDGVCLDCLENARHGGLDYEAGGWPINQSAVDDLDQLKMIFKNKEIIERL